MARTNQSYAAEFKREAVALVTAEHSITEVAHELGVPQQTLWKWVDHDRRRQVQAAQEAAGPVDPAAYAAALKRIAELERENAFLGKVSAFFARKADQ
jgi:transposase